MKQFIVYMLVLMISLILNGCTSEQAFTQGTAKARLYDFIPPCTNDLKSFNSIAEAEQSNQGYTFTVTQNCEPVDGEGPQMETIYKYLVSPDEIKRIE